jgi:hypothetical protein
VESVVERPMGLRIGRWDVASEQHPVSWTDLWSVWSCRLGCLCCLVGLLGCAVAVALNEPGAVVAVDEASHGLAELLDGIVQLNPQALVLEGADPALGAAVGLRLTQERGTVGDPEPGQRAGEMGRAVLRPPVMAQLQTAGDVRAELAPAVNDGVIDRLEGAKRSPTLATCAQASAV